MRDALLARYKDECDPDVTVGSDYDGILIALDSGSPVGIVCYDTGSSDYKVGLLHVTEDAPEGTAERLMSSVMSAAQYQGASGLQIHALDPKDRSDGICRRMGFTEFGSCSCSQRSGATCLRMRF